MILINNNRSKEDECLHMRRRRALRDGSLEGDKETSRRLIGSATSQRRVW